MDGIIYRYNFDGRKRLLQTEGANYHFGKNILFRSKGGLWFRGGRKAEVYFLLLQYTGNTTIPPTTWPSQLPLPFKTNCALGYTKSLHVCFPSLPIWNCSFFIAIASYLQEEKDIVGPHLLQESVVQHSWASPPWKVRQPAMQTS